MTYIGAGISRFNTADELTVTGDAQIDTTTLVVDSTNNRVGIGTASPATALDVTGTITASGSISAEGGNAPTGGFHLDDTGGTSRPRITNDASNATVIRAGSATGNVKFNNFANTTELVNIKDNGNIGVGTSSPGDAKLYVEGGQVIARYDHTTTSLSGNTNLTAFPHSLSVYNGNGTGTTNLASIGFSIDTTGAVTNGAIVGHSTAAGSMDLAFYTESSNAIGERGRFLAGGGLTFNGDTAAANALDDYEEGTWTPTSGIGNAPANSGHYTKVGRLVTVYGDITFTGSGTATANIDGLPYTVASPQTGGAIGWNNIASGTEIIAVSGVGRLALYNGLSTLVTIPNGGRILFGVSYQTS